MKIETPYFFYKISDFFKEIRCWFRHNFNKNHFKTVWEAFKGYPFDYSYTLEVLKMRLIEQAEYFKKSNIVVNSKYYGERIELAISLLDIIREEKTAGHFEYDGMDEDSLNINRLKYVPDRHVNLRNAKRYNMDKDYILKHPTYLYEEKAYRLFWRIMEQDIRRWWD